LALASNYSDRMQLVSPGPAMTSSFDDDDEDLSCHITYGAVLERERKSFSAFFASVVVLVSF
jgi:hypothetical protein